MKTAIFKMLAIVVAIGGAYASVRASASLAASPYVQYTTDNTNDPACTIVTGASCSNLISDSNPCIVGIVVGSTVITTSYSAKASGTQECGPLLKHGSNSSVATKVFPAGSSVIPQ